MLPKMYFPLICMLKPALLLRFVSDITSGEAIPSFIAFSIGHSILNISTAVHLNISLSNYFTEL